MKSKHHIIIISIQYVVLILAMFVASLLFQKTADNFSRFYILLILSLLYILWGVWHHGFTERLDKLILLEYSLVSAIVILLSALGLGIIRFF
ncbi:hypothetical protein CO058_02255 [candidate division WWE3 bacterium CG_4_9_14_0_2_um_filter_35_11]|uniref:Uncharacterized protein n=1 Tax=candidate division WWE3 bacterium CG_4_9_14_0_2_um_filter_35_11 TaxID=1975077 RepID=A0A2M8ELR4_UNCKA|nr:MAG: hypothetical protein COV25_00465 [candidate division WWE3 bacterium CG10_big_fil_rev_8_21_14_0_10_35_32]PJC23671.1 MAG: hypothetical protein CO058_02255 [candidate division WWE3 bacterium CG_4_9_14_0_2_um_filter_35_11]